MHNVKTEIKQPTIQEKICSAFFVMAVTPEHTGIKTLATLMWPHKVFSNDHVRREAAKFVTDVHIALLEEVHPLRIQQILTDQDERLSFVL